MTDSPTAKVGASKATFFWTLLMHQFIGTVGVMILAGMLTAIALEIPNPWVRTHTMQTVYGILRGSPYFPVQIVVALLLGWLLSDFWEHKSMAWVWVLPYAWLVYDFARLPSVHGMAFQERLSYFFGRCTPGNDCIDQLGVTLPFYVAVAYSLGALLAYKLPVARRKVSVIVFTLGILVL